jgi:cell wall-associated NlpC family hydrolase
MVPVLKATLALTLLALVTACASRGPAHPQPFPPSGHEPASRPSKPGTHPHVNRIDVVHTALSQVGRPYRSGGMDPAGFDCSGLVSWVFGRYAVQAPRGVQAQFDGTRPVSSRDIKPADLLFFSTTGPGPTHVAIALGDGRFVHAPNSRGKVRVESLDSTYWSSRYIGARRLL